MTIHSESDTHSSFHSIYWDPDEITDALHFLDKNHAVFLGQLTKTLNSYNGLNRSTAYYDFLCGEWLMHFSHAVYAAYLEVTRNGSPELNSSPLPVLSDHSHYINVNVNSFSFNQQLRSLVSEVLRTGKGIIRPFVKSSIMCGGSVNGIGSKLKRGAYNYLIRSIGRKTASLIFCYPNVKCSRTQWLKALWKWRDWAKQDNYSYPVVITTRVDGDWRCSQSNSVSVTTFRDVFQALLPLYIPVIYLEGFTAYRQQALALKLPRPKAIYTVKGLYGCTLFKTLAADWREEGTKILSHQGGGGYGISYLEACEIYELRQSDQYYSFGWRGFTEKVKPLCFPIASSQYISRSSNRLLLNLFALPCYVYRIQYGGMPGTIEKMISNTKDFVLETKDRCELIIRPHNYDYGWGVVETLRRANPNLRLDDMHTSGLKSYRRSALVIHSYLGTSWLETLSLNIPTVCFYDTDIYAFRDAAKPYIDNLVAAGILQKSGSDAARFVIDIMSDPQAWWQKREVQEARQDFVRKYANFTPDWTKQWEEEFSKWID